MKSAVYTFARRCSQTALVIVLLLLPWLIGWGRGQPWVSGNLYALKINVLWGLPFSDPVAALQVLAGGDSLDTPLLWGALLSLLLACALGRVFCSWLCPYGFLSEVLFGLARGRGQAASSAQLALAFAGKGGLLLLGLGALSLSAWPLISLLSMPGELSLLPLLAWLGGGLHLLSALALPVAALALEVLSGRRIWCRYLCPQSVLLGLAARLLPGKCPGLRLDWQSTACHCKGQRPCEAVCALGLTPRQAGGPPRAHCSMCGDCRRVCARHGAALRWQWGGK